MIGSHKIVSIIASLLVWQARMVRIRDDTEGLRARGKQGITALGFAGHCRCDRLDLRMSVVTFTVRLDRVMIHGTFVSLARKERASTQRMTYRIVGALPLHSRIDNHRTWNDNIASI